mmetsp:Transcript_53476/g.160019  ORF Transcript_53476/g.160019 Transcript_53476/m.160019 type:complete len:84 (+) Transcript_53476:248-499(+)
MGGSAAKMFGASPSRDANKAGPSGQDVRTSSWLKKRPPIVSPAKGFNLFRPFVLSHAVQALILRRCCHSGQSISLRLECRVVA